MLSNRDNAEEASQAYTEAFVAKDNERVSYYCPFCRLQLPSQSNTGPF